MGVIGVVSALTIPNLNYSTGEAEKVAKFKKSIGMQMYNSTCKGDFYDYAGDTIDYKNISCGYI